LLLADCAGINTFATGCNWFKKVEPALLDILDQPSVPSANPMYFFINKLKNTNEKAPLSVSRVLCYKRIRILPGVQQ
jgi:hypothetical protein